MSYSPLVVQDLAILVLEYAISMDMPLGLTYLEYRRSNDFIWSLLWQHDYPGQPTWDRLHQSIWDGELEQLMYEFKPAPASRRSPVQRQA